MLVLYAAAALAVALIGVRYIKSLPADEAVGLAQEGRQSAGAVVSGRAAGTGARASFSRPGSLVVHVAGAVRRPGVVRVRDGDRVGDAIRAAGGASARADLDAINLALRLADGQQVLIPARGSRPGPSGGGGPISLSTATPEQLDELDGVGPGLAAKIVAYRTEHGGFRSVDELAEVPGIGDKRLEALRAQLQP